MALERCLCRIIWGNEDALNPKAPPFHDTFESPTFSLFLVLVLSFLYTHLRYSSLFRISPTTLFRKHHGQNARIIHSISCIRDSRSRANTRLRCLLRAEKSIKLESWRCAPDSMDALSASRKDNSHSHRRIFIQRSCACPRHCS